MCRYTSLGTVAPCAGRRKPPCEYTRGGGISPSRSSSCGPYRSPRILLSRLARCEMPASIPCHSCASMMKGSTSRSQGRSWPLGSAYTLYVTPLSRICCSAVPRMAPMSSLEADDNAEYRPDQWPRGLPGPANSSSKRPSGLGYVVTMGGQVYSGPERSSRRSAAQVQCQRMIRIRSHGRQLHGSWRVSHAEEARQAPRFRFIGIDREGHIIPAAGMRHMVTRAAQRTAHPAVHEVESQRCMHADGGMQCRGQRPGPIAHASHIPAHRAGGMQWHAHAIAGQDMAFVHHAAHLHLQALQRGIDEARGAAGRVLLAEHMPGLQRIAQLHLDIARSEIAEARKAEFEMRREPCRIHGVAGGTQLLQHIVEVFPDEMRQQEPVMQLGAPAFQRCRLIGSLPEARQHAAQQ